MIIKIKRQPQGGPPYYESFIYNGDTNKTVAYVLDTLNLEAPLKNTAGQRSRPITWECSCLQNICGACGMRINGKPGLACATYITGCTELTLEPLTKFPVIEDLWVDKTVLFEHLKTIGAWLTQDAKPGSSKQATMRYDCAKCMRCGLCLEVCPNYLNGKQFFGAAAVPEAYLIKETGSPTIKKRFQKYIAAGCSKSGACEKVCPAGIQTFSAMAALNKIGRK